VASRLELLVQPDLDFIDMFIEGMYINPSISLGCSTVFLRKIATRFRPFTLSLRMSQTRNDFAVADLRAG
jgi:hypothetical protein